MRPQTQEADPTPDLCGAELKSLLNQSHPPCINEPPTATGRDVSTPSGPCMSRSAPDSGIPTRLMVGLSYLNHSYGLADEEVVEKWVEHP